jgi:hypothetical protein
MHRDFRLLERRFGPMIHSIVEEFPPKHSIRREDSEEIPRRLHVRGVQLDRNKQPAASIEWNRVRQLQYLVAGRLQHQIVGQLQYLAPQPQYRAIEKRRTNALKIALLELEIECLDLKIGRRHLQRLDRQCLISRIEACRALRPNGPLQHRASKHGAPKGPISTMVEDSATRVLIPAGETTKGAVEIIRVAAETIKVATTKVKNAVDEPNLRVRPPPSSQAGETALPATNLSEAASSSDAAASKPDAAAPVCSAETR